MSIVWKEIGSGGAKIASGQITDDGGTSASIKIECGFKPKYICIHTYDYPHLQTCCIYNEETSKTKVFLSWQNSAECKVYDDLAMWDDSWRENKICEVNDTGFKVYRINTSNIPLHYFAVG